MVLLFFATINKSAFLQSAQLSINTLINRQLNTHDMGFVKI